MSMLTPDLATGTLGAGASRQVPDPITDLLLGHARELTATALEVGVRAVMDQLRGAGRDVVRNGCLPKRLVTTVLGDAAVQVPRVRSRDGQAVNFASSMIPKYLRRSSSIDARASFAYLKGVPEAGVAPVLEVVLGEGARRLAPALLSELEKSWTTKSDEWDAGDLAKTRSAYPHADGIYQELRGGNPRICVLVLMGVDDEGRKHSVCLDDGAREPTQSRREAPLDAKTRGLDAPRLAIGDGALGSWAASSEVPPSTRHQKCWMHESGGVLDYLPKTIQARAKVGLHQIWMAGGRTSAEDAIGLLTTKHAGKYPEAVDSDRRP